MTTKGEQPLELQRSPISIWIWYLAAVLPFLLTHLFLYLSDPSYTGFIQGDQPYYVANGRAIFDRGNGIGYPNPYDYQLSAPVIYYHWLPWLFGLGTSVLRFDPGLVYFFIGAIASVVGSRVLFALLEERTDTSRITPLLLILFTWGSGIMVYYAFLSNVMAHLGSPARWFTLEPLQYEPYGGWWFLDWGRNNLFATESVYHLLVVWCWLSVVRKQYSYALLALFLIATTHPWTGVELLAMIGSWIGINLLFAKKIKWAKLPIKFIVGSSIIAAGFLWYYFIYLPSFPAHYNLVREWYFPWLLPIKAFLLSHFWVMLATGTYLWKVREKWSEQNAFFLICFIIAFLLAKHDWFVQPIQPLHFTRGYTWLALAVLGAPYIKEVLERIKTRRPVIAFYTVSLLLVVFISIDNLVFLVTKPQEEAITLAPTSRELFTELNKRDVQGVFVSQDSTISYLSATYTNVRPILGQVHLTPQFYKKLDEISSLYSVGSIGRYLQDATLFLDSAKKPKLAVIAHVNKWKVFFQDSNWTLYSK